MSAHDRYGHDVLSGDWRHAGKPRTTDMPLSLGLIVEVGSDGYCGEVVGWENGMIVLEDRNQRRRTFPVGEYGYLVEGRPVALRIPPRRGASQSLRTPSGSRTGSHEQPHVALGSRIYVEGRHDAELVEKIWGDDLRHVGVVVEYMGGMDDLLGIVAEFEPAGGRRLGVLIDHLVANTKESRVAAQVRHAGYGDYVKITGHRFIDVWQTIKPDVLGIKAWPDVPMDRDFKKGTLAALGIPRNKPYARIDQADVGRAWQAMLARVSTYRDLDMDFVREVEKLIDFVTQDHIDQDS
ncbi:PF11296 family protein [Propionibacterium freudenreichii]|uniref:DUF3097 domain-containing protein n=1 Tax=Propionibacterium freudenreichii TaxID=1744 RepID=UPI000BC3137B|nr:DUF3097 domain-containing protein [Propionibacterium freudenreichii]SBN60286.1 PF11296 family protein [Propionibacterium freudenreichii]SBN95740.1 PF11296 family protein [Propionibacterium freudenreichii]SCC97326.1 PF11296 family protein [Propionibacterium freudenreichii]SCQ48867.1 PF11296 family protein [Propionibacterium freudenreichii]SCQ54063.1 PF11296 family protein [Propionibacterium freudenreichii]